MRKKVTLIIIILFVATILYNLGRQISDALNAGKRLDKEATDLSLLQQENKRLRDRLTQAQTYDFVENIARNKLNMGKKDETVVIIPQSEIEKVLASEKKPEEEKLPNWQGWLRLIFH